TPGGQRFRLAEQRGKVLLVNFWATWCGPCREEMPAMERLWQRQKDQGFVLVAVSVDIDPKVVHPYLAKYKLTFPVALDPKLDVGNAYGVRALPSSFVVDREGYVAALGLGVVFVSLGASFSVLGQLLLDYRVWIRRIGGLLIVVFGLSIVGVLRIGFLGRTQQLQLRQKPAGYVGSFLVGVTFGIGWTPC